jgi:hypothetical protein
MTITLHLEPELESQLLARAVAQGVPLDVYLRAVIQQAARQQDAAQPTLSGGEFDAGLDALAAGSENLPILPPEAYRRDSIYEDE